MLDNAPTYLSFTAVAAGQLGIDAGDPTYLASLLAAPGGDALLAAISCGAVLMGCLTYIGNGPNLMVKEIAEHRGVTDAALLRLRAGGDRGDDPGVHRDHVPVLPPGLTVTSHARSRSDSRGAGVTPRSTCPRAGTGANGGPTGCGCR